MSKIWCPTCEVDKFELTSKKAPEPYIVFENHLEKLNGQDNTKTCDSCGTALERK